MRLTRTQHQLRELMRDDSELCYCAGWMDGTEYRLWRFVVAPTDDGEWGMYKAEPELRENLKELAEKAAGWIIILEDDVTTRHREGNGFVRMEDWLAMYDAWMRTSSP